jgi:hypothetical protein
MNDEELKKLIEENLALTKEVKELAAKTATYIKWLRISDIIKILLIVLPLIAAWVYLPDLLQSLTSGYSELLPPGILK